jgi:Cu+-exporting ATPase
MLLSFPEYFEVEEFWINQYRGFFRWLIFALSLPSFLYSASGYYVSAWKSIKSGLLNIDIPIALGIVVMFVRSTVDIVFDYGQGFFDSMTGLIFFMLLGKLFQKKPMIFYPLNAIINLIFLLQLQRFYRMEPKLRFKFMILKKGTDF